ncbi:hypothetical protein BH23GEM2_BH23GEM2_07450 [soil metagenome]
MLRWPGWQRGPRPTQQVTGTRHPGMISVGTQAEAAVKGRLPTFTTD